MLCKKCGNTISPDHVFCSSCGLKVEQNDVAEGTLQSEQSEASYVQAEQPESMHQQSSEEPIPYQSLVPEQPMKWHKFLIYFSLFAGAIINLINGVLYLTGYLYNTSMDAGADMVYATFPGLRSIDVVWGIICVGLAVFGIYTRFSLAKFRARGPELLFALYITVPLASLLYIIAYYVCVNAVVEFNDISLIVQTMRQVVINIAMAFVNRVYYRNRAYLFVN